HLYLTSAEISALFFQQDVISSKLQRDNVLVDQVFVCRKTHPDLFNELVLYEAPEIDSKTESINLFPLDRLPLIIDLYSHANEYEGLKAMALELLQWFDPHDPFWKGDDDDDDDDAASSADQTPQPDGIANNGDEDSQTESSADNSLPSLDDLQQVLRTLEIKRKRILGRMLAEAPTADCVEELNTVELHISRVEALISKLESDSAPSTSSNCQKPPLIETDAHTQGHVQSFAPAQRTSAPSTPQAKTTHKVAPMVQEPSKANPGLQQDSNLPPLLPSVDLSALLQQQMWMNQMNQLMMQQLGLAPHSSSFPGQLPFPSLPTTDTSSMQMLNSFGRGLAPLAGTNQQQQQQQQQLLQLQNQLLQQSGGAGMAPSLQNSQIFSQLPSLSMLNSLTPATTSVGGQVTGQAVPPGLGMLGVSGVARGRAATTTPQSQVGAMSPQPGGLQALLQQPHPQPNFALSAFQNQQHRQQ
ncbi:hypothetical protein EGW08_021741, partial [Elysia chlorotica]